MKATELLKRQSRCVTALFHKVEGGQVDALRDLSRLLVAQLAVERELFFPAVLHLAQNEVLDAWDNHSAALRALSRALASRRHPNAFRARVSELKTLVMNLHAADEQALFIRVERKFPDARLEALGSEMEARFFSQLQRLREKDCLTPPRKRRTTKLTRIARGRCLFRRPQPALSEPEQRWSRVA